MNCRGQCDDFATRHRCKKVASGGRHSGPATQDAILIGGRGRDMGVRVRERDIKRPTCIDGPRDVSRLEGGGLSNVREGKQRVALPTDDGAAHDFGDGCTWVSLENKGRTRKIQNGRIGKPGIRIVSVIENQSPFIEGGGSRKRVGSSEGEDARSVFVEPRNCRAICEGGTDGKFWSTRSNPRRVTHFDVSGSIQIHRAGSIKGGGWAIVRRVLCHNVSSEVVNDASADIQAGCDRSRLPELQLSSIDSVGEIPV